MKFLLSFSVLMLLSINANADTIISCGASEGHAYFLQQGLIGAKDAGWEKDGISTGAFSLVRNGDNVPRQRP